MDTRSGVRRRTSVATPSMAPGASSLVRLCLRMTPNRSKPTLRGVVGAAGGERGAACRLLLAMVVGLAWANPGVPGAATAPGIGSACRAALMLSCCLPPGGILSLLRTSPRSVLHCLARL
jgi:hypothetical protein